MKKVVYKINNGFGYKIINNGKKIIIQEHNPQMDGFKAMSEEEANTFADDNIYRINNPIEQPSLKTDIKIAIDALKLIDLKSIDIADVLKRLEIIEEYLKIKE